METSTAQQDSITTTPEETAIRVKSTRKGRAEIERKAEQLTSLTVQYMSVDKIMPNDWNPNRQADHDFELLCRSMEDNGFTQPVVTIEGPDGSLIIVDGEHRWRAAQVLGYQEIPVVVTPMSPEQARIATITHNRARGSHDIQLEADLLRDLQSLGALDWAQDSLMLDDLEINKLLEDMAAPDALADEDFSNAWVPDSFSDEEKAIVQNPTSKGIMNEKGDGVKAMTPQSIEMMRRREELMKKAKTAQDRINAKKETSIYRVSLVFSGNEADIVKAILGDEPAVKILEMCISESSR